jgi:hypothetical protein
MMQTLYSSALKGQCMLLAQRQRPGYKCKRNIRPVRAKAFLFNMLLPLQGALMDIIITQGDALG